MTLVLAHRGEHHEHPENTLDAFRAALALRADGIELDVHSTADGVLVVHHDPVVPGAGAIGDLRARGLPSYVPSLAAVLDECAGAVVNVEVKASADATPGLLVALLAARPADDRVVVSSFAPAVLDVVVAAGIETAWLVPKLPAAIDPVDPVDLVERAADRGYRGIHPVDDSVTPALVGRAHRRGLAVRVWTVNDPARAQELDGLGVDAVITDEVAAVRAALSSQPAGGAGAGGAGAGAAGAAV